MEGQPPRQTTSDPDEWVEAYADLLFRYALTRLRRRQDAEDVVQETLLAALRSRREFRGDSTESTWLIGILRNKIVDRIRLSIRDQAVEVAAENANQMDEWCGESDRWLHAPKKWQGDPARLLEDGEFWEQVRSCFGGLSERQAQVFALRTFDGLAADEICKQTGLSATNLWVLLHRARNRLRACLEESWFTQESKP